MRQGSCQSDGLSAAQLQLLVKTSSLWQALAPRPHPGCFSTASQKCLGVPKNAKDTKEQGPVTCLPEDPDLDRGKTTRTLDWVSRRAEAKTTQSGFFFVAVWKTAHLSVATDSIWN